MSFCICKTWPLQKGERSQLAPNQAVVLAASCISSRIQPAVGSRDREEGRELGSAGGGEVERGGEGRQEVWLGSASRGGGLYARRP
jgi:hypothetical protein